MRELYISFGPKWALNKWFWTLSMKFEVWERWISITGGASNGTLTTGCVSPTAHTGPLPRANFHVYRGKNVEIQPPKLSKFQILATNLYLKGDSFAIFLRNSQYLYASIGSF